MVAQYPLHKALDEIWPLLRAGHDNQATNANEPVMRSPKQGILNATLPVLKLTLSEPRETISTLIHALMRRPAARKLRSKTVVLGQAQSNRPLASLMLQSAPDLDLASHDNTVDTLASFEIKSKDLKGKVDRQL
jgi:hypothetical protein